MLVYNYMHCKPQIYDAHSKYDMLSRCVLRRWIDISSICCGTSKSREKLQSHMISQRSEIRYNSRQVTFSCHIVTPAVFSARSMRTPFKINFCWPRKILVPLKSSSSINCFASGDVKPQLLVLLWSLPIFSTFLPTHTPLDRPP